MESTLHDLRYTLRTLRRDAGFAIFAMLIIALGIGASSTVFSVLDALLVKPLPFKDPGTLVWIANRTRIDGDLSGATLQVGRFLDFRQRNRTFADIAGYFAFYGVGDSKLTGDGEPERLSSVPVSQNFFPLLGVQPQLGRQFTADECKWNGPHVVMLSHGLWVRRFGSDPSIVGRTIRLDNADTTVVGVLPASFDFAAIFAPGTHIDLFAPFPLTRETDRWGNTLAVVGRLKHGAAIGPAQAEADVLGAQITRENPHSNSLDPKLTFLREHVSGRTRPALMVLVCAVAVMMLIVCANLSNLLLARAAARRKEVAIRMALGAPRKRLIRQLLTESLVLTGAGSLFGFALAILAARAVAHLDAFNIPLLTTVNVNPVVLGFTILAALVTGVVLSVAPTLYATLVAPGFALGQRGSDEGKGHAWARAALVVSEIAFACVLLVGAGLLTRSLLRVLEVDPGFRPESAAAWRVDPDPQYKTQAQQNAYFDEILHTVRAIPGVQSAGLTDVLPLGHNRSWGAGAKGQVYKDADYPTAFVRVVSDGYLQAMGMTLKKGRDFTERDTITGAVPVMMINETLARRLWPGQDPIGKSIVGDCVNGDRQVVGVVGDVRHVALEQSSGSEMYMPIRQCQDWGSVDLVVRSTLPLPVMSQRVEAALRPLIPALPRASMRPLTRLVDRALSPRRFVVLLLTGFAAFALVLVSLGIYGVVSYSVTRRTAEIGIRMALGAQGTRVQRQIVTGTLGLAAIGIVIGALASAIAAHALSSLLFGVTFADPSTFVAATLVMLAVAGLAGYLPARRASRIDPMVALRVE
ncbi:MAG TPA: ABC transporter permease [Bryobacteraceae bacterium]|nr:ABC transporter permease [Bryobacteraceae bacterium]